MYSCAGYVLQGTGRRSLGAITKSRVARTSFGLQHPQLLDQHSECVRKTHNQASNSLPPFDHAKRFGFTQPPCPEWTYGDGMKQSGEQELWGASEEARKRKVWDLETVSPKCVPFVGSDAELN
jgi:hypothetical protein